MNVSIIITCYNREKYIARCIRSTLSQTFPRDQYEIIVVDDGSTDHSQEIISDFGDEIITIFHDKNKGLPTARNNGIKKAKGRFVVHLDSDDYIHSELIHMEYAHLAMNNDWGAVACDYIEVDDKERHTKRRAAQEHPIACGIMFRVESLIDIGLYNEKMLICEDEELRRRYDEKFKIGYVHLPLYRYRRHNENITNDTEAVKKFREQIYK